MAAGSFKSMPSCADWASSRAPRCVFHSRSCRIDGVNQVKMRATPYDWSAESATTMTTMKTRNETLSRATESTRRRSSRDRASPSGRALGSRKTPDCRSMSPQQRVARVGVFLPVDGERLHAPVEVVRRQVAEHAGNATHDGAHEVAGRRRLRRHALPTDPAVDPVTTHLVGPHTEQELVERLPQRIAHGVVERDD